MLIRFLLPMVAFILLSMSQKVIASETEPNDTIPQADTLVLNGSNTGAINSASDKDWWQVTTTADGRLNVSITISNGLLLKCDIYDNDGTTLLANDYTNSTKVIAADGLAPGTYFIKLYPYNTGQMPAYTVSNTFLQPTVANDAEPNNNSMQAKALSLNASTTGHVGYYYDHFRDTADWYKITTNADGMLRFTLTSANSLSARIYLYDADGATQVAVSNVGTSITLNADGLAAGIFYVKVIAGSINGFTAYTLADSLFTTQYNDLEPNDNSLQAKVLALNGSTTGHYGFLNNKRRDTADWYKITINADGRLRLTLTPTTNQASRIWLYDADGNKQVTNTAGSPATVLNVDGLAAGTFYIKVTGYQSSDFASYTLSDSLFPAQFNDVEPNNNKMEAKVLAVNDSTKGHYGFINNNQRDTADWYKITIPTDGLLRITLKPTISQASRIWLYDADGIRQITNTSGSPATVLNADGLAAGTFYIKVTGYQSSDYAYYTLTDSLFPNQYVDAEPNDNKTQAKVLSLNNSTVGHYGFINNNKRDTADWYKITTNTDGLLRLTLTPTISQTSRIYIYDADGTTLITSTSGFPATTLNADGLAPGTFYVKVTGYQSSDFASYTLSDSSFTYNNAVDKESNQRPYLAKTIPANDSVTGHVGFRANLARDTADWWRVNYTGSSNLDFVIKQERQISNTGLHYLYFQVYKDTTTAPIFSNFSSALSWNVNLTSLTQGYYWIKVASYQSSDFMSYSLSNTFTQVNIAKVNVSGAVRASDCSATNKLTIKCSGSKAPYTVQLYRYGVAFGTPKTVKSTAAFSFTSLPSGVYKITAYGDGATGTAFGTATATFVPVPTVLSVTNIATNKATLNWDTTDCVKYYQVQYRKLGVTAWTTKKTIGNKPLLVVTGLIANTGYEWHVAPVDSANGTSGMAPYSVPDTFTTAAAAITGVELNNKTISSYPNEVFAVYPNPASTQFTVQLSSINSTGLVSIWLKDMNGSAVWSKQQVAVNSFKGVQVDVSRFASGLYILSITDSKNKIIATKKVIVTK